VNFEGISVVPLGDYIRGLRIDFARRALLETDAPLIEIALNAGFSDQSRFTRAFRCAMGLPPAQFRKSCRRNQIQSR
jgi:AraC family transcriptional regulator